MKNRLLKFTEFDKFYVHYSPLTPYGVKSKNRCQFFYDIKSLEKHFDIIDAVVSFSADKTQKIDKIEYRLKRIPELPSLENPPLESTELFLVKKFLINFKAVVEILGDEGNKIFRSEFESDNLLNLFLKGGSEEAFHISDIYSEKLKFVRSNIENILSELRELKQARVDEIKKRFGYDFTEKDFLILKNSDIKPCKDLFYIEAFDSCHVVVKPVMTDEYYKLFNKKESFVNTEKKLEQDVLSDLSAQVFKEKFNIERYINYIEKIDTYIANLRTVFKFNMTRPILGGLTEKISVIKGRNIVEEKRCVELKTDYQPLTAAFDKRVSVIHGSNMGGKTVLLKTLGLFQTLVQAGFYVPADSFTTQLFNNVFYIGDHDIEKIKGLSGFGMEIKNFMEAKKEDKGLSLYLMDEFAKTTDSDEAAALINAVIKDFSDNGKTHAFISTHFKGLEKFENTNFYRMKGLDLDEYEKHYKKKHNYTSCERIRLINRFMKYEVVPDDYSCHFSDALKIAEMLGFDSATVKNAVKYLKEN